MVGMLQIITYLLCLYLVYKGLEIFQIALVASKSTGRSVGLAIGALACAASVVATILFAALIDAQALKVGSK